MAEGGAGSLTLVLGGARSGKSRHAEGLVAASGLPRIYIATAEAWDEEMRERIAKHRADRGPDWTTVDAPLDLARTIAEQARPDRVVLVDCLTLWLTNVMLAERDVEAEEATLLEALREPAGPIVCVSNETGLGIVPDNALARRFRDAQGRLNQRIAAIAARVDFIAAGLPIRLKG
ncbi:MAG: bifunctional adenosylcobinamide kinase/adenosylcobinamide-phosphate guanylyltransferase, partial [Pseudomonadota bacterium]